MKSIRFSEIEVSIPAGDWKTVLKVGSSEIKQADKYTVLYFRSSYGLMRQYVYEFASEDEAKVWCTRVTSIAEGVIATLLDELPLLTLLGQ